MQSESTQHSDNKHRHAHHRDHSDLDRSTRSFGSSSSGVGIASTFLQNQISLQRTLNDWDETNPEYMARKKSLEEEKEQDNEKKLAFPPSGSVALSSPSSNNCTKVVCNPPAIDTVPTEGGFLHASYTFDDEMMMTLATGESLAHLNRLRRSGEVSVTTDANGVDWYQSR